MSTQLKIGDEPGGIIRYLHPVGLMGAVKAMSKGFSHKKFEGKETQLPAAFIIKPDKTLAYVHYGKNISDVPDPSFLARHID